MFTRGKKNFKGGVGIDPIQFTIYTPAPMLNLGAHSFLCVLDFYVVDCTSMAQVSRPLWGRRDRWVGKLSQNNNIYPCPDVESWCTFVLYSFMHINRLHFNCKFVQVSGPLWGRRAGLQEAPAEAEKPGPCPRLRPALGRCSPRNVKK